MRHIREWGNRLFFFGDVVPDHHERPTEGCAGTVRAAAGLVEIDLRTWHGSSFHPRDVLDRYAMVSFEPELFACAACKSENVHCIFLHYLHHPNESDVRLELVCGACGKFTHHEYWR